MKKILFLLSFIFIIKTNAQTLFSGQVFMRENSAIYLNQVFVTNLNEHKTTISNYNGEFKIPVKIGDVVRFTSIISERYDVKITEQHLKNTLNLIELSPIYYDIKEVVINWKPSGNLRKDVLSLKDTDKKIALAKTIGLPQGKSRDEVTEAPIVGAKNGSLSLDIQSIYDVISGERKKKQRLYQYEKMMKHIRVIRNYFGDQYFINHLKIPQNMIDNFLQFVYSSDNLAPFVEVKNIEKTQVSIEKYLPIYQKRLRNSNLTEILQEKD